jgi:hypothetical protein
MDPQIEAGINDKLRSHWARGEIAKFFNRESKDPEVEANRKRFISQLNLKNGDNFENETIQQILEKILLAGSPGDKMRIAGKFVTRIQTAIANLPEEEYTVPQGGPPQDLLNTTVAEDAGLNESTVQPVEGLDFGGKRSRKQKRKLRKTRKLRLRKDRPMFAEELDKPIAGGKKHRK